jgi:subtilisin family serine protease
MRHLLAGCFGILSLAACNDSTAPAPSQSSTPRVPVNAPAADVWAGHYIVVLKDRASTSEEVVQRHSRGRRLTMDQHFKTVMHGFAAAMSDEDLDSLRNDPDVESIEPDRYVHQMGTETGMGWALDRVDQHAMPLNGAFAYGATGAGVNVYVVDGGIRYSHQEFGGRAHFAFDALGGNGSDCNGHGTGVAGIVGGNVHGVAKGATIYSVRVFPCSGSTPLSTILAGIDWVTAHHKSPAVANLSLGATGAPILDSAVARSIRSGVTYVVAAGNNGGDACAISPGKLKDVINVGATDASDSRASWSNYGSCITMFAPGVAVASADYYSDVSLASWNGTSMSAPMVTGAVALYLQGHPTASPATVRGAIVGNTTNGIVKSLSGSANKLLYTAWIGSAGAPPVAPPAPPAAPSPPPVAPVIPIVTGATVSYKCSKNVCAFDASSSRPSAGVSSYAWTFGDGKYGTGSKWVHTYPSSASYTWSVTVVDRAGRKYVTGRSVTPASATGTSSTTTPSGTTPPPTSGTFSANFSVSCNAKHSCTFDAGSSVIPKGVSSYNWNFGDGYQGTTVKLTHDYSGKKTVSVTLKIYDKSLAWKSLTRTVTVP